MKPAHYIAYLFIVALLCWVSSQGVAQAPAGLSIQTYAGLSITGSVGAVYIVQYSSNLAQPDGWQGAAVVQLPSSPYLWVDTTAPVTGERFYRAVVGPTNLVWLPPGTFTMGSPTTEAERWIGEGPQTVVTLTSGFFMGKCPVTQGEYLALMGTNPSYFRNGTDGTNSGGTGNTITNELSHPVEMVSWSDATNYCARLTTQELSAGRLPSGWLYRLPTETEWEYACRAGATSAFDNGPALRSGMANFDGVYEYDSQLGTTNNPNGIFLGRTTPVGSYEPNGWGLYDMHGNVREWCSDVWDGSGLPGGRVMDPQGPLTGTARLVRGGGWHDAAGQCRSAYRLNYGLVGDRFYDFGFRVVLASNNPCLNNNGGCIASQTCTMSSGGRICSGNSCGVVECTDSFYCQSLCGGVCVYPSFLPPPGYPRIGHCDNSRPQGVNTCNVAVGCNTDEECQTFCGGVCLPPDYSGGGSFGHCDNTHGN